MLKRKSVLMGLLGLAATIGLGRYVMGQGTPGPRLTIQTINQSARIIVGIERSDPPHLVGLSSLFFGVAVQPGNSYKVFYPAANSGTGQLKGIFGACPVSTGLGGGIVDATCVAAAVVVAEQGRGLQCGTPLIPMGAQSTKVTFVLSDSGGRLDCKTIVTQ